MEELIESLYQTKSFMFGEFKLKSGLLSPVYIDLRGLISEPDVLPLAVDALWNCIQKNEIKFDNICGVPYAALPLACGVCMQNKLPMLMKRKEAKDYGTKKLIEGKFTAGQRCLIVEDVVTQGSSISETAQILREEGLVVEDAVVLMNRQQGAEDRLKEAGINVHSVLTMADVMSFMVKKGELTDSKVVEIKAALAMDKSKDGAVTTGTPLTDWSLASRIESASHPKARRLLEIMKEKETNLCLAADLTTTDELVKLVECVGSKICLLKLHADIIVDFGEATVTQLKNLSLRLNFLIMEDRKFSDTGNTVSSQLCGGTLKIVEWADFITVHSVPGSGVIDGLREGCKQEGAGIILVSEMSSKGNLTALPKYTAETVAMGEANKDVVCGFVCQKRCSEDPGFLFMTPGVHIQQKGDAVGQQFRDPSTAVAKDLNDIAIVGRGIYKAKDPAQEAERYRMAAYEAFIQRCR